VLRGAPPKRFSSLVIQSNPTTQDHGSILSLVESIPKVEPDFMSIRDDEHHPKNDWEGKTIRHVVLRVQTSCPPDRDYE
jgi:hypothetical protein